MLLGAGASVKSGIPLATDMAHQALRWAMALSKNQLPEDPRIRESDVRLFMESQSWFDGTLSVEDLYQNAMRLLNTPRELRRTFLMDVLHNVPNSSKGYFSLANLAKRGIIRTILTTNFDDCFEAAYAPGALIVASKREEYKAISTIPQRPQLIYLHGKAEYYMDRIMTDEVQKLDDDVVDRILPLLRDHPLIVIGYRGAEPSVMKGLFLNHLSAANLFPQGIFWCVLNYRQQDGLSPMTQTLATEIDDNFALVNIAGFDEFIEEFADTITDLPSHSIPQVTNSIDASPTEGNSFDLQPANHISKESLNLPLLHRIVSEHSKRIGVDVPSNPGDEWYDNRLQMMGLLTSDGSGVLRPTNAAVLLCSDEGRSVSRGHWIEIRTPDRPPSAVDGSLLHIYDSVFNALEAVNRPIRIKGYQSRDQLRYGHIAIKELLANALVHRDYQSPDPTIVFIGKNHISFENPGGLDEPIIQQISRTSGMSMSSVREEFQDRVYRRDVGASYTAYRNPVLADVFWGLGYVDKAGSGLMDAVHSLREIGGDAKIQVPENNNAFTATISIPHIKIDDATLTAIPKRPTLYYCNLVEFESVPPLVWVANTHIKHQRDASLVGSDRERPSFALRNDCLYSFANISDVECPLHPLIVDPESVKSFPLKRLLSDVSTDTVVPELLRRVVEYHMAVDCGLRVDRKRRRAYYVCYHSPVRSVSYRATRQRVSRRVAWWPDRLGIGQCVHTAVSYQIVPMRHLWGLTLQPTYVITTDGKSRPVPSKEHTKMVTGLLSDHYNPKVLADVRFWLAQLETEPGIVRIEQNSSPPVHISTSLTFHEGYSVSE